MVNYKLKDQFIRLSKNDRLYHQEIPIIGLTGGVATGKSTVSSLFIKEGFNIINADALVHSIYKKKPTIDFIQKNFPQVIKNDSIDFKTLRKIFFEDKKNQELIEKFIYQNLESVFLEEAKDFNNLIIYDVPLLFEKGLKEKVDLVICVYCPVKLQLKRLMERDHIEESLAQKIIQSQIDIEKKKELSDIVINNAGSLENTLEEFKKIKDQLFVN
jgi:dephospho-CoA kinase